MMKFKMKIPIEVSPIMNDGFHLFVKGKLGRKNVRLLLDTGASKTVLAKKFINDHLKQHLLHTNEQQATGLGSNQIVSEVISITNFKLVDIKLPEQQFAVLDLKHVNETYQKLNLIPIDGVLGSDILVSLNAVIDLKTACLQF